MNPTVEAKALVSVIIPVFNDTAGVVRCLRSIATQSYPIKEIEAIVVDNGSDPPLVLDEHFPFELKVLRHAKPGSYAARNAGIRISKGEVLTFTDADCIAQSCWIEQGLNTLLGQDARLVVGGEVRMAMPENPTPTAIYQSIVGFRQRENIEQRGFSVTANLFCRRSDFDAVGPFNEDLLSGGDLEWCWRARAKGIPTTYAPDAIVDTSPRSTLRGAMLQARRVSAGRLHLARLECTPHPSTGQMPRRGVLASARWILRHPGLRPWKRLQVLGVAVLIRLSATVESVRVRLGGLAERR